MEIYFLPEEKLQFYLRFLNDLDKNKISVFFLFFFAILKLYKKVYLF